MSNHTSLTGVQTNKPLQPAELMEMHGMDPQEWDVVKTTISERAGTYQQWAQFKRKVPETQWPVIQGATVNTKIKIPGGWQEYDPSQVLIVPDMHVGYRRMGNGHMRPLHDTRACGIVAQVIQAYEPDTVVMLGDNLDLAEWSSKYLVTPDLRQTTQLSLEYLANWIASWRNSVSGQVFYLEGNHEKRLADALVNNLIAACGLTRAGCADEPPVMSVPHLLGLEDLQVNWVGDYPRGTVWLNDNLRCTHAQAVARRSGMTVANSIEGARCSTIFGHAHRLEQAHVTAHSRGKSVVYGAYCMGTLGHCDGRIPSNTAEENWQQGFGWAELYENDRFHVTQVPIINGIACFNGEIYHGED